MRISLVPDVLRCQKEAMKKDLIKSERLGKMISILEPNDKGIMCFQGRIWVPYFGDIRSMILNESHKSRYSIHPGTNKMYRDLKPFYWWPGLKRDIA